MKLTMMSPTKPIVTGTFLDKQRFFGRQERVDRHDDPKSIIEDDEHIQSLKKTVKILVPRFSDDCCHCSKCEEK